MIVQSSRLKLYVDKKLKLLGVVSISVGTIFLEHVWNTIFLKTKSTCSPRHDFSVGCSSAVSFESLLLFKSIPSCEILIKLKSTERVSPRGERRTEGMSLYGTQTSVRATSITLVR